MLFWPKCIRAISANLRDGLAQTAARRDLADIWFYTFDHWNAGQADAYVNAVHSALAMAAENPSMGRSIDEARAGYWRIKAGRHICYFKRDLEGIIVMRVLRERMDALGHL